MYIKWESPYNWSWGDYKRSEISSQLLTVESAEEIIRSYPNIEVNLNIDSRNNKFDWEQDDYFEYAIIDLTSNDEWYNFQQTLAQSLTGMTTPTIKISYLLTQGSVWNGGQTYSVGVDAENGRMVYHLLAEGTPLGPLFDALD